MARERRIKAVVIGASWGGIDATIRVIRHFPRDLPVPVFLAQHLRVSPENRLPRVLGQRAEIEVVGPMDKEEYLPGKVYVAPPGYHMLVDADGTIGLGMHWPVLYSRPSVDELFFSAAHVFGRGTLGILLTGANEDGAEGMDYIARRGGLTIAQNPETAEAPVMPASAIDKGCVQQVLELDDIGERVVELVFGLEA